MVSSSGIQFIVGIILARLLSPQEYGLIGMTAIFTAISQTFVDSGFSAALIRKKTCTNVEFSTVFYYSIVASIIIYALLYLVAPYISNFFGEEQLTSLIRVISLNIIVLASSQIQRSILIKRIEFKRLTIITVVSMVFAGFISINMALHGYGVWSLAVLLLARNTFISILVWLTGSWKPSLVFSIAAFKELFGFGSKILASALINSAYENTYSIIIGKYFSVSDLGFYSRARRFSDLVGKNVNSIVQRVSFPVMASISDDIPRLRRTTRSLIISSVQLTSFFSLIMAGSSPALIPALLGSQWSPSIPYLQLLSFASILFPVHSLNLNILKVMGRSDLFLKIEVYKKLLAIPTIFIGILFGILPMLYMIVFSSVVAFYINASYSGKLIGYSTKQQIKDIIPGILLSLTVASPVYLIGLSLNFSHFHILAIQLAIAVVGGLLIGKLSHYPGVVEIREVVVSQLARLKRRQ